MAFNLQFSRMALSDTMSSYVDIVERELGISLDNEDYVRVIDKAEEISNELDDGDDYGLKLTQEYDELLDAFLRFEEVIVFEAAKQLFINE